MRVGGLQARPMRVHKVLRSHVCNLEYSVAERLTMKRAQAACVVEPVLGDTCFDVCLVVLLDHESVHTAE